MGKFGQLEVRSLGHQGESTLVFLVFLIVVLLHCLGFRAVGPFQSRFLIAMFSSVVRSPYPISGTIKRSTAMVSGANCSR